MVKIKQNLKVAQDRHKAYVDKRKIVIEFKVGQHVLLNLKPNKSSLKLGSCTKMETRFCGPFEILDIIGPIAYMLALSASMNVHNVFYVSLLKKYVHDPNHVIDWHLIHVETEGYFQVKPVQVLDRKIKML